MRIWLFWLFYFFRTKNTLFFLNSTHKCFSWGIPMNSITWIPCYIIPTRIRPSEREVLTCMWLLTSPHVSPISLISGLESCDLWPLGCLTAPVPQADVSPPCHVSSTPLFTVTVVSGCLAPQSPWLLPQEGVREVGEATCHCPTAMERAEGLGLSMTAGNTTHCVAKDHSNRGERERENQKKWLHHCNEWQRWLLRSEKLCLWRQQSHSGPIFLLLNQVQAITWNDWTISQSQIVRRHHKRVIMCLCFRCCFWAATTPKGEKGDNGKSTGMLYEVFLWK